jgi:hypothetical protein
MRLSSLVFSFAIYWLGCAQTSGSRPLPKKSAGKTDTSSDGSFQFSYPASLIRCELRPQQGGERYFPRM